MNYLSHYLQSKQQAAFSKHGAFFAYKAKDFRDRAQPDVKYKNLLMGGYCPEQNFESLLADLKTARAEAIKEDKAENGKEAIIRRELVNYECGITSDISEVVECMKDYGYTKADVIEQYNDLFYGDNADGRYF